MTSLPVLPLEKTRILIERLKRNKQTIATAESCTGGLLAATITSISGASEVFQHGEVTYSNYAKEMFLGVKRTLLDKYTAVSWQVAEEMAIGIREIEKSDFGVSITGYAEIDENAPEDQRGLVYICVATKNARYVLKKKYENERNQNRLEIVNDTIDELLNLTQEEEMQNEN